MTVKHVRVSRDVWRRNLFSDDEQICIALWVNLGNEHLVISATWRTDNDPGIEDDDYPDVALSAIREQHAQLLYSSAAERDEKMASRLWEMMPEIVEVWAEQRYKQAIDDLERAKADLSDAKAARREAATV